MENNNHQEEQSISDAGRSDNDNNQSILKNTINRKENSNTNKNLSFNLNTQPKRIVKAPAKLNK